eukprot:CAMPEP_0174718504 /NCGR_PEP_ID=MMETSP1094-20130205/29136_1 /TAXON_ID=156173 /ORGANISM="Chrysochromulina brevifilum, Strain UTEX LB 985" /LENGTH=56 /DNA_ID=CAMNT_0015918633 /DNA_START=599 /DNA_END=769 /DNA_ORIENTATION=-
MQISWGVFESEAWCDSAEATAAEPTSEAATQVLGTRESMCMVVAATEAPTTTAAPV